MQLIIQTGVLTAAVLFAGVKVDAGIPIFPLVAFYLCFVATSFGLGLIGASNFFNLEVKQGREPLTWLVDILARIFSGIYYPLAVLPRGIQFVSRLIPHTYAMEGLRLVMLNGRTLGNDVVRNDLLVLFGFATISMVLGIFTLNRALNRAAKGNGVGMVV